MTLLAALQEPNRAWLILLIGIVLVYREFAAPGRVLPGVVGAVGIFASLYALYQHPWRAEGVALLLAGIGLIILQGFRKWYWIPGIIGSLLLVLGAHRWTVPEISLFPSLLVLPLSGSTVVLLRTAVLARRNKVSVE